jgi:dihydrofolate reductase
VRLAGGAQTIQAFIDADSVDTLHVAVVPVQLRAGSRLWQRPEKADDPFHPEAVPSSSGVVHHALWRP